MEIKKCPKCNANIDAALSVCLFCGANVNEVQMPYGAQNPYGAPQQPVQNPYAAPQQPAQNPYAAPQQPAGQPYGTQMPYGVPNGGINPAPAKKKGGAGKAIAIILGVIVVLFVIIVAVGSGSESGTGSTTAPASNSSDTSGTATYSDEFLAVFNDRNIIYVPELFYGLNTAAFAQVDEDDWIWLLEVGYDDNDVINVVVDRCYADVTGYSEEGIDELEDLLRDAYSETKELDYVTIDVSRTGNYLVFEVTMIELENPDYVDELERLEILETEGDYNTISFEATRDGLISDGYEMR